MWRQESSAERRAREQFDAFYNALNRSEVAVEARAHNDISSQFPEHYLHAVAVKKRTKRERPSTPLPEVLQTLLDLQEDDGKWLPSKDVVDCLGGERLYPVHPDTFSDWRWCTALVIAYLRRHPQHFNGLHKACDMGLKWTDDEKLMMQAKDALPPGYVNMKCSFVDCLDEAMIKDRRWKDNVTGLYQSQGYLGFMKSDPEEEDTQEAVYSTGDDTVAANGASISDPSLVDGKFEVMWDEIEVQGLSAETMEHNEELMEEYNKAMSLDYLSTLTADGSGGGGSGPVSPKKKRVDDIEENEIFKVEPNDVLFETEKLPVEEVGLSHAYTNIPANQTSQEELSLRLGALQREYKKFITTSAQLEVGGVVECNRRRTSRWGAAIPSDAWHRATLTRINIDTVDVTFLDGDCEKLNGLPLSNCRVPLEIIKERREAKLLELQNRWSDGISLESEWKVLKSYPPVKKVPSAFNTSFSKSEVVARGGLFNPPDKPSKYSSKSRRSSRSRPLHVDVDGSGGRGNNGDSSNSAVPSLAVNTGGQKPLSPVYHGSQAVVEAENKVIMNLMKHESEVQAIHDICRKAVARYKKAVTQQTAIHVWDPLVQKLGQLRLTIFDLVESVQEWRTVSGQGMKPFIWNEINHILKIPHACDFLSHCKPLADFFGDDFTFKRNPLFTAVPLDNRPVTPRKGTNTVLIDGKEVEQHSDTLAAERSKEMGVYREWIQLHIDAPRWWPRHILSLKCP